MDDRKSAFAVATFLFVMLGILLAAMGSFLFYRSQRVVDESNLTAELEALNAPSGMPDRRSAQRILRPGAIGSDRVERLQSLLDRTSRLLELRTQELEQKNREHDELRNDLFAALNVLEQFVERENDPPRDAHELAKRKSQNDSKTKQVENTQETNEVTRQETEESIEDLKQRLELYDQELTIQTVELEELRRDLAVLNADMVEDRVFGPGLNESVFSNEVRHAIIHAFIDLGSASVPALVDLLDHERPDVRRFAADALGELGELAQDAEGALTTALADADTAVSESARTALSKIR